jgi:hypothetical protein
VEKILGKIDYCRKKANFKGSVDKTNLSAIGYV